MNLEKPAMVGGLVGNYQSVKAAVARRSPKAPLVAANRF